MVNELVDSQDSSSSKNPQKHKLLFGCLLTMFILITLIIIGKEVFFRYNIAYIKGNPTLIPASFSGSLREHDYRMVKELTDPNVWPEIETWMNNHERIKCPLLPILTFGDEGQGSGISTMIPDQETYLGAYYINIVCPDPKHYYCLGVIDIIVKQKDDQWIIVDVGSIEEFWAEYNCDFR